MSRISSSSHLGRPRRARRLRPTLVAALVLAAGGTRTAHAQQGTIAGTVTSGTTGAPLEGAQVAVEGTNLGRITGTDGRFRLQNVGGTEVTLRVTRIGFRPASQRARVGDADVRITLVEAPLTLDQLVVTGTAGGEQKRSLGNSVTTVDAVQAQTLASATDLGKLINGRAPGVLITPNTGVIGSGPSISIRGRSTLSLSNQPLIYIDGIRVANDIGSGPANIQGAVQVSRLNDLNPDDVESMEIIKGPAAATIYGTEAANGVIQIITKRGRGDRPEFSATTRQGTTWFMDAAGRWPTNFAKDASGTILSWNAVRAEEARGTPIFSTGRLQNYRLSLAGTSGLIQYFVSGSYDHDRGIEPTNKQARYSAHGNFGFAVRPDLDIKVSTSYLRADVDLGLENGRSPFFDGLYGTPLSVGTARRGFFFAPPEVYYGGMFESTQNVNRFTGSMQIDHRFRSWFNHQVKLGLDQTDEDNVGRVNYAPENAQYFGTQFAKGNVNDTRRNIGYITLDYNASARAALPWRTASTTSVGAQIYRRNTDSLSAIGTEFPAPGVKSVSGAAVITGGQNFFSNTTIGFYAQQQFGWGNRFFLTGAVRVDNNSAFGQNFDLATYPKVSASWVVSDEPWWGLGAVDAFKLRAAYGASGQQPQAFAALRTYLPTTGPGDVAAVTPQFVGNPDLKPERGEEIEAGFEASVFDRIGIDLTYFSKKTRDAILLKSAPPSLGFPGQQFVNIGATSNRGLELALNAQALQRQNLGVDLGFSVATAKDRVDDLGALPEVVHQSINSLQRSRVGRPIAAFYSKKFVSGTLGANGIVTGALCEDGAGGTTACASAPLLFIGTATPRTTGTASTTLTLWRKVRLYGLVDFKMGHYSYNADYSNRCKTIRVCEENVSPEKFGPRIAYEVQNVQATDPQDIFISKAGFAKLREVSASYTFADALARRAGASRALLTIAARNLHTWTDFSGLDPETRSVGTSPFTNYNQATTPQLAQFLATLSLTF